MSSSHVVRAGVLAGMLVVSSAVVAAPNESPDPGASAPMPTPDKSGLDAVSAKIHAQLRSAASPRAMALPAELAGDDTVLVEVTFAGRAAEARTRDVLTRSGAQIRNELGRDRVEATLPASRLRDLAGDADVVTIAPARLVRHLARTSEGVAAGRADRWLAASPSYDGSGIKIAVIDGFNSGNISTLQGGSDWPPNARLTRLDYKTFSGSPPAGCSPTAFGCMGVPHGNAVLEIIYDLAPAATYRAYDTVTVGDWRRAILDAANLSNTGGTLGAIRANVISASLGAPLDGKGDGTSYPGSIAEAAGWARGRGILVVNAAGNERDSHWGGLFTAASSGNGFHTWSSSNTVYNELVIGNGNTNARCIPAGELISVDLYWSAWPASPSGGSTRDYDLFLYRRVNNSTWETTAVAQSTFVQNGGGGQTPQEQVQFVASGSSGGCAANQSKYGIAVTRVNSTSNRDNLQVFSNNSLRNVVNERSLGFPADSPKVLTVAAIDVVNTTNAPQEWFSSEGPVLGTGGVLPTTNAGTDPNLKPDVASFDNVTTVSYGNGGTSPPQATSFLGTSAATPHVAGMAAQYMQRVGVPASESALDTTIVTPLRTLAALGANDLGTSGRDYQYGYGRLRFQRENALGWVQQPSNVLVNATMSPAVQVRVLDDQGFVVPVGIFTSLNLAIGTDPTGGAGLIGGGNATLAQGVATWNALSLNAAGNGFTLRATAGSLSSTSNGFNVTTGAATRLRFAALNPGTATAGISMTPAIQVRLEDASGNLVTADSSTQVSLFHPSCSGNPVQGGAPKTAVNGIVTFPNVRLYQAGTAQLQAFATGFPSTNTQAFAVASNPELIFNGVFECLP